MRVFKILMLVSVFFVEMGMFFGYGFAGYKAGQTAFQKYAFMIGLPAIAIMLWGIFAAPKSKRRLKPVYRLVFALTLYFICSVLLYFIGQRASAVSLIAAAVLCEAFLFRNKPGFNL